MLTRRSVRIKTMQALYAAHFDNTITTQKNSIKLEDSFDKVYHLYYYLLYQLYRVAQLAPYEKERREAKHLPTEEDLNFDDRISKLNFIQSLENDALFNKKIKQYHINVHTDDDDNWVKKIFNTSITASFYQQFLENEKPEHADESKLFYKILQKKMLENESYSEYLEELFPNYEDDKKVVIYAIKTLFDKYADSGELNLNSGKIDQEETDFGKKLLKITLEEGEALKAIVVPKLVKWDWDRIALIDAILLKMAVAELLHFQTIPVKVTINEYIDIAKLYSTPKSKDFINGLLDKIMNGLKDENKIVKTGRGLKG